MEIKDIVEQEKHNRTLAKIKKREDALTRKQFLKDCYKFYDKVAQDIEFKMACDLCGKVDDECEFTEVMVNSQDLINICYDCNEKSDVRDE